jgi:hypothetical protein
LLRAAAGRAEIPGPPSSQGAGGLHRDTEGTGRYDLLEVETRGFSGLRTLDSTGLPLHTDNQSVIKERIYSHKSDRNILHDEITVIDHAFTQPWTVMKDYRRSQEAQPVWRDSACVEDNQHVRIGTTAACSAPTVC